MERHGLHRRAGDSSPQALIEAVLTDWNARCTCMRMTTKRALFILVVSMLGVAFSASLTYQEMFSASAATCPAPGAPGTVFGYPACVYGFFMYLLIAGTTALGLLRGLRGPRD